MAQLIANNSKMAPKCNYNWNKKVLPFVRYGSILSETKMLTSYCVFHSGATVCDEYSV